MTELQKLISDAYELEAILYTKKAKGMHVSELPQFDVERKKYEAQAQKAKEAAADVRENAFLVDVIAETAEKQAERVISDISLSWDEILIDYVIKAREAWEAVAIEYYESL